MFDMPTDRQAALIAFDMQSRGEATVRADEKVVPQLADGVEGTAEAASRLAEFMVQ